MAKFQLGDVVRLVTVPEEYAHLTPTFSYEMRDDASRGKVFTVVKLPSEHDLNWNGLVDAYNRWREEQEPDFNPEDFFEDDWGASENWYAIRAGEISLEEIADGVEHDYVVWPDWIEHVRPPVLQSREDLEAMYD